MKTRHAIEVLKAGWLRDPCWDIKTTPGFEAHADQLGTHGLLRLLRRPEDVLRRHEVALFHLTEGRRHEAWRVLSGRQEPEDEAAEPETDGRDSRPGQGRGELPPRPRVRGKGWVAPAAALGRLAIPPLRGALAPATRPRSGNGSFRRRKRKKEIPDAYVVANSNRSVQS